MSILIGNKPIFGEYKVIINDVDFDRFMEFANEDISCELLNGDLIIHSPANYKHETIFKFLLSYLEIVGEKKSLGKALGSRFVVKLDENWAPEPDILFYKSDKAKYVKETYFDGAPNIIVEILSPSNREDDLNTKLPKYLKSGIPEVWIIDPEKQSLTIHITNTENIEYTNKNEIVNSRHIPEIKFKLEWVFDESITAYSVIKEFENISR